MSERTMAMLDDYWGQMLPSLAAFDGATVADMLIRLRDSGERDDLLIWNGLRNRINKWFGNYFARKPLTAEEEEKGYTKASIGPVRFTNFLYATYSGRDVPDCWHSADLRYICQQLWKMENPQNEGERRYHE